MFNENLPHQQYKLVETPSQATVEELLPNKRTKKWITGLNNSIYSKSSDTISTTFFGVKGERLSSLKCLPFHGELMQLHQIMQKYLLHLVLYKQRFLLIHSIFQDSHTVSNLNSAQSNPLKLTTQRLNWQTNFLHQQNAPLQSLHMRFFNCLLLIKKSNSIEFFKKWQNLDKLLVLFVCLFCFVVVQGLTSIPTRYQPIPLDIGNETPAVIQILQLYPNVICLN